ncbi:MAG: thiamine-phosphate kinase, partial [Halochromatium sp.]
VLARGDAALSIVLTAASTTLGVVTVPLVLALAVATFGGGLGLPDRLPLADQVAGEVAADNDWTLPLSAGDDYELCFTLPPTHIGELKVLAAAAGCPLTQIGEIEAPPGLRWMTADGHRWHRVPLGYDHFAAQATPAG